MWNPERQPARDRHAPLAHARRRAHQRSKRPRRATSSPSSASSTPPPATPSATRRTRYVSSESRSPKPSSPWPSSPRPPPTATSSAKPRQDGARGPDFPLQGRRRNRPDDRLRHGRAPPGHHQEPDAARVRRRGARSASRRSRTRRPLRSPVRVETRFIRQTGGHGQYAVVELDFEPAPDVVRRGVRRQVKRRNVPVEYIPAVEEGIIDCRQGRRRYRLPGHQRSGDASRRQVAPRGLLGAGVQRGRRDGAARGPRKRRARSCWSPS